MIHFQRLPHAKSVVEGHEGPAIAVWLNRSQVPGLGGSRRGVTGYFRLCKRLCRGVYWTYGEEFHGIVLWGEPTTIRTTEGMTNV